MKMENFLPDDDSNGPEVVVSNKGGPKIIHNGYMYTLHKKQPVNLRWRCVRRTLHCRGSLITTSDIKKPRLRMEHNHGPDHAAAQLARKRYIALGQPAVLSEDDLRTQIEKPDNVDCSRLITWGDWPVQNPSLSHDSLTQKEEEFKRITRSVSRNTSELTDAIGWETTEQQDGQFSTSADPRATKQQEGDPLTEWQYTEQREGQCSLIPQNVLTMPDCFANNCKSRGSQSRKSKKQLEWEESNGKISFHRIPKDPLERKKWLDRMGLESANVPETAAFCSLHFNEKYLDRTSLSCTRLYSGAVPFVFVSEYSKEEEPPSKCRKLQNEHSIHRLEIADYMSNRQILDNTEKVIPTPMQTSSDNKAIRIGQSLIRPRNIAPAPSQQSQPSQQQHHQQQQQQQQQQQHQQQHPPKTLVLKTIPLKVKHVAPTTIKMAPRQIPVATPQVVSQPPTEVCLRWNSYHSNMQNSFPSLLDSEQFVDVTLACEGRSLKCHKMILSSCSDYLADLLRENPCQHPIILMKDLKFWEVEALVKFMYKGEVNVAHDKLPELLNAAEALQVKGLAGPSPTPQSAKPPMLIPQSKPSTSQPIISRISAETKETKTHPPSTPNVAVALKRTQKRRTSESNESIKPFTKIRLQRPASPTSPVVTVKLEPLDIPLSPTEMFANEHRNEHSASARFTNVEDFHGEEDPEGDREHNRAERELNFCEIPGPPDLNDNEEQMEFVPTDFLEQEQDTLDDHEQEDIEQDVEDGEVEDDGEDGEDDEDGEDGEDINDKNEQNRPGRNRDQDDEVDDEDNDIEYSEKLSDDNNMT